MKLRLYQLYNLFKFLAFFIFLLLLIPNYNVSIFYSYLVAWLDPSLQRFRGCRFETPFLWVALHFIFYLNYLRLRINIISNKLFLEHKQRECVALEEI